ncbi:MAG: spermine synthase, partial [Chloroflexota bacterium]
MTVEQGIVLSHFQIKPLLKQRRFDPQTSSASLSSDLGLTTVDVALDETGILFPGGERLTWEDAAAIAESENGCFVLEADGIRKI